MKRKIVAALTWVPLACFAGEWTPWFSISSTYAAGAENYNLRIYGVPAGSCSAGWAYINQSATGSKVIMSSLMLAFATNRRVQLYLDKDESNYCKIIEAAVGG
ncbi:hypothetical protein V4F39_06965 [Aquincola sp. MAHUQ-54]|uniref:Uncharacterized protein n=1 Tax=Aquincola agrisoli TaxID=3119538 RepID=A0AAW9QDZ2_9BURK